MHLADVTETHHLDTSAGKIAEDLFTGGVMMLCLWPNVPNKEEVFLIWHIGSQLSIRNGLSKVCRKLWLFEPRKGYGAAQSSTSMELWFLMDLDLYASDIIGNPLYEKVYWGMDI